MTELELFDKVNPRRDLPQATCDVISQVYKVMNLETEQLKIKIKALESANKAMVKEIDDMSNGGIDLLIKIVKLKEENEQVKQQIEKEKKFSKDVMNNELRLIKLIEKMKSDVMSNIKWAEQNKNNPMYCKLNSMINQWKLAE